MDLQVVQVGPRRTESETYDDIIRLNVKLSNTRGFSQLVIHVDEKVVNHGPNAHFEAHVRVEHAVHSGAQADTGSSDLVNTTFPTHVARLVFPDDQAERAKEILVSALDDVLPVIDGISKSHEIEALAAQLVQRLKGA